LKFAERRAILTAGKQIGKEVIYEMISKFTGIDLDDMIFGCLEREASEQ